MGGTNHHHRPRSLGCWGSQGQDPETAPGWAQRGSRSYPGDTLGRERWAFGNSRDFVLNPVGLLVFEDTNDFFPTWQNTAAPQAQPEQALSQAAAQEGKVFVIKHLQALAAHQGHELNSGLVNSGLGLHPANQVWMRPNHTVTTLRDLKARSQILRNSRCTWFREVRDTYSSTGGVPKGPKNHLRAGDQPCYPMHAASWGPQFPQGTEWDIFSP